MNASTIDSKIAASLEWETATLEDLWEWSDLVGRPASTLLCALQ